MFVDTNQNIVLTNRSVRSSSWNFNSRDLLILLAFCEKNIVRYVLLVMSMIPVLADISKLFVPVAYVILIVLTVNRYHYKIGLKETAVLLFILLSIALTCLIYPQNSEYIFKPNNFWNVIFPCLKYFIIALIIIPDRRTLDMIGKASCLAIVVETAFVFLYMIPRGLLQSDEMSRAYQLLPNILFALNYAFNRKKLLPWILSSLGIFYILAMGTRGPIMILLAFFVIKFLKTVTTKTWIKVALILMLSCFGLLIINSNLYMDVLNGLRELFVKLGLSTRIIDLTIDGTVISHLAGRDELYDIAIRKISERPILGYGIYGEWQWFQWNAHNMYLEIMLHYGVMVGSALLIWVFRLIGKTYFSTMNGYARDMILIWFCFVFIRGIFGGSYLMFGTFFLIGFCIGEQKRVRTKYYSESNEVKLALEHKSIINNL